MESPTLVVGIFRLFSTDKAPKNLISYDAISLERPNTGAEIRKGKRNRKLAFCRKEPKLPHGERGGFFNQVRRAATGMHPILSVASDLLTGRAEPDRSSPNPFERTQT